MMPYSREGKQEELGREEEEATTTISLLVSSKLG
jgi:hypothetical protein